MIKRINIGDTEYLKIPVFEFVQNDKKAYISTMQIADFAEISALRQIDPEKKKYEAVENLKDVEKYIIKSDDELAAEAFNRPEDKERIQKIFLYLGSDENPIIPGAIIVGGALKKDNIDININPSENDLSKINDSKWIEEFNNISGLFVHDNHIYIAPSEQKVVIIDGQHRYLAMKKYNQADFSIPIVFLLGYKPAYQANLFYTINYEQKPVNKSLLENLKNTFLNDLTEGKIVSQYIEFLNNDNRSPLVHKIKMYGTGTGFISFSYLYNLLLDMINIHSGRSKKIPIFYQLYNDVKNRYFILQMVLNYLRAIQESLNNVPFSKIEKPGTKCNDNCKLWDDDCTILTKSVGLGAFFQVFPKLILKILDEKKLNHDHLDMMKITLDDFMHQLKEIHGFNFESLSTGSSLGLQNAIKTELEKLMGLEKFDVVYFVSLWTNKNN